MRVQFVWPNFDCPIGKSIGISYLSSALKQAGHDTRVEHICEWLDNPFVLDSVVGHIKDYNPDLIAFSTGANHYPEMRQLSQTLKKALDKPILFGGIHTTLNAPAVMTDNPWIDFANVGEGDDSVVELVNAVESGTDTSRIGNVWSRKNGELAMNPPRALKDITTLPWMDLDVWEFKRITESRRGWVNLY
ncbi:MAG: cobalamin B12-binding domain-containing protein, partial [Vicinamibacterales bacterium]